MIILAGLVLLWLLAALFVNLKMEGKRRSLLTGVFRILLLLTFTGMGTAFHLGTVPLDESTFLILLFTAVLALCGNFLVSDFALYWKNKDADSAKKTIQAAASTQVGMIFLFGLVLFLYERR